MHVSCVIHTIGMIPIRASGSSKIGLAYLDGDIAPAIYNSVARDCPSRHHWWLSLSGLPKPYAPLPGMAMVAALYCTQNMYRQIWMLLLPKARLHWWQLWQSCTTVLSKTGVGTMMSCAMQEQSSG